MQTVFCKQRGKLDPFTSEELAKLENRQSCLLNPTLIVLFLFAFRGSI